MSISREEILTIASLARLEVDEQEVQSLTTELSKILDYMAKLNELDTTDVEPTAQVTVDRAPLRPDERTPGIRKEDALAQAPRADETGFLVPGFVD